MTPEQLKLLKAVRDILNPSTCHDLLYRTPAMALREQANRIEYEDKIKYQFDRELYFWEYGEYPPEIGNITNPINDINITDGSSKTLLTSTNLIILNL